MGVLPGKFPAEMRGVPSSVFNGKPGRRRRRDGSGSGKYKSYIGMINPILEKTTTVKVGGKATRTGDKINIAVEVDGADGEDLKLRRAGDQRGEHHPRRGRARSCCPSHRRPRIPGRGTRDSGNNAATLTGNVIVGNGSLSSTPSVTLTITADNNLGTGGTVALNNGVLVNGSGGSLTLARPV